MDFIKALNKHFFFYRQMTIYGFRFQSESLELLESIMMQNNCAIQIDIFRELKKLSLMYQKLYLISFRLITFQLITHFFKIFSLPPICLYLSVKYTGAGKYETLTTLPLFRYETFIKFLTLVFSHVEEGDTIFTMLTVLSDPTNALRIT